MKPSRSRRQITVKNSLIAATACGVLLLVLVAILWYLWPSNAVGEYKYVSTIAGWSGDIGEPFGVAVRGNEVFVSDGQNNKIWRIENGKATVFADGLDTPAGLAFAKNGDLIVADSGSQTIKSINQKGEQTVLAKGCLSSRHEALENEANNETPLNGPMGVAVDDHGKIFFTDTYNDRICVIEKGMVYKYTGGLKGYEDGDFLNARFDTPTGIAVWHDGLLVADSGNRRLRVVESGPVWTLAGSDEGDLKDGLLSMASFVQPTSITVDANGAIFITDGNAIRRIGGTMLPMVTTISSDSRGEADGPAARSSFNRPSGLAIAANGDLIVADSENQLVRSFSTKKPETIDPKKRGATKLETAEEFRNAAPARWPYDPPTAKRDIAGTLGEIRGLVTADDDNIWFHNGLDIAGAYGETARFIRDEKVLRPIAAENFGTLRELIRMPTLGYIHIRLGRNADGKLFDDARFQFQRENGKLTGVRVPRGTKFKAGDPIGTLNPMNHVHLIAGRTGGEMNALDALILPGISDSRPPVIEKVELYDQNWQPVETVSPNSRIKLTGKTRIVVRAYDQMDGNSERRRLGVYKLSYIVFRGDAPISIGPAATTVFDWLPSNEALRSIYANGSHSGATGETIFNYVLTNSYEKGIYAEGFLDPAVLENGQYGVMVYVEDYFKNRTNLFFNIEVVK